MARIIFQLGTNNWQRGGEFAPGSGILHEAHHLALADMADTHAYSMWPSRVQRTETVDDPLVRVFALDHDIPICESISPVSSYRWHSMSGSDFDAYRSRLQTAAETWIDAIETDHGQPVSLAIVHHTFLNPLVMADINRARLAAGRPRIPVLCFVHGTALKMYAAEARGDEPEDFPRRFLPLVQDEGVFSSTANIDHCAAISTQQVDAFSSIFGHYPPERILLSPNGYNQSMFAPRVAPAEARRWRRDVLSDFGVPGDVDRIVAFCGKFASWKRLDALLHAATIWERDRAETIATIIIGSGPEADQALYHGLAADLGLENAYFVGPRAQDELATLFSAADVGCFPSKNEPFGLVFIEAMACGTPVIGADSGGPRDFVTDDVGTLVAESDDIATLAASLASAVGIALDEDWKLTRGPAAAEYAASNFSVRRQVQTLLADLGL